MKLLNFFLPLFIAVYIFNPKYIVASEIVIAADNWCPINCDTIGSNQGFMVEIAKTIFEKKGHTINYIQLPWNRAVFMAREGEIDGIVGAFHGDAPDFIFPQNEQSVLTNSFYALKNSNLNIKSTDSLQAVTLGIVSGYDYGINLNEYIREADKSRIVSIGGDKNLVNRLMALLESKRVDVIVEADLVFKYETLKMEKHEHFKHVGNATKPMKAYIAFSPNSSKSLKYSKILSDGMEEIKLSGELGNIMEKYLGKSNNIK